MQSEDKGENNQKAHNNTSQLVINVDSEASEDENIMVRNNETRQN